MIFGWGEEKPKNRKRKAIPKDVREQVWKKYMKDKSEGKCYCCKARTITFFDFEVGHNLAKSKGGSDNILNLRPICPSCNKGMGTTSIEAYRAKHYAPHKKEPLTAVKTSKGRGESNVELDLKVRKHIKSLDYEILTRKGGFDLCAKKSVLLGSDKYLAIAYNQNSSITPSDVRDFLKRIDKFADNITGGAILAPVVNGLIAYTGDLPKEVAALVKGNEPPIYFKKF